MKEIYHKRTECRICKSKRLKKFLGLGEQALANSFIKPEQEKQTELKFPLEVYFCENCNFVQLLNIVSPEVLFKNYIYVSGTSAMLKHHFADMAKDAVENVIRNPRAFIVEVASNDGTLLKEFKKLGCRVLGIEPAENIADIANRDGIPTEPVFFNSETAVQTSKKFGKADAIVATNVFAHIDNLEDFVTGFSNLVSEDGVIIIESPYLMNLIEDVEYDTIYHEHVSYLSIRPLKKLFERFGLEIFDAKRTKIHGGSIRIFVQKAGSGRAVSKNVSELESLEVSFGLDKLETYIDFSKKVEDNRKNVVGLLKKLKLDGKRIAGYGAPAKGSVLLQYCGIKKDLVDYTVDRSPFKQGLLMPGSHIQVFPPEKLLEDRPDYVVILAWNFAKEIMKQQEAYKNSGGKFIIPIPKPIII